MQPLKENRFVIPKSRYDSISTYLSPEGNKYNDIDLVYDKNIRQQLINAGEFYPFKMYIAVYLIAFSIVSSLHLFAGPELFGRGEGKREKKKKKPFNL